MEARTEPIPVFDRDGQLSQWLADKSLIHVWQNHDLGSAGVGGFAFTRCATPDTTIVGDIAPSCECKAPHWRYGTIPVLNTRLAESFRVYRVLGVASGLSYRSDDGMGSVTRVVKATEFSDTAAGARAAGIAAGKLSDYADTHGPRTAPAGRFWQAFTVERVSYETRERRPDGNPYGNHYRVAVLEWSATDSAVPMVWQATGRESAPEVQS